MEGITEARSIEITLKKKINGDFTFLIIGDFKKEKKNHPIIGKIQ